MPTITITTPKDASHTIKCVTRYSDSPIQDIEHLGRGASKEIDVYENMNLSIDLGELISDNTEEPEQTGDEDTGVTLPDSGAETDGETDA